MLDQILENKPKSIHDIIPSEFFTKYINTEATPWLQEFKNGGIW
jgi:hypothetical protein